ncbi:MAG: hypothetical protein JO010_13860 [Alphaproteobacteria bacterium]|nr:hypothetical protein [Alphaproteobacteria bacterium]
MDRSLGERVGAGGAGETIEASSSAVSWAAIIAGALVAASVSLILLALGSGLGLASVSPWTNRGVSATTFTVMTGIWLIIVQWVASGMGGYLTGRLRTKWVNVHTHEVFFRDTAHGFLTWATGIVISAAILASAASAVVGGGVRAAATAASGAAQGAANSAQSSPSPVDAYSVDTLFRSDHPDPNGSPADMRAEATRILGTAISNGDVSQADRGYLAQLVAARTGIPQADAQKRVDDAIAQVKAAEAKARQAADAARKAAAAGSIFTALSMLIGAFIACAAAALGGRLRDEYP